MSHHKPKTDALRSLKSINFRRYIVYYVALSASQATLSERNDEATLPNFWRESDKLKTGKRGLIRCMAQFITIIRDWPDPLVADENGYHPATDLCQVKQQKNETLKEVMMVLLVAIMPWSNGCITLVVLGGKNTTCTLGCSKEG
ncbi:hypothetical protein GQX74_014660 [Glossina fuscipes]|nr:hypothetical protein GQX74_014660 [Glossina fuscipes]